MNRLKKNKYFTFLKEHTKVLICGFYQRSSHVLFSRFFFHFNIKFTPFLDKKLPDFVIYFSCISKKTSFCSNIVITMVEKVSKIDMLFNLKIFLSTILNFCAMIFFKHLINRLVIKRPTDNTMGTTSGHTSITSE